MTASPAKKLTVIVILILALSGCQNTERDPESPAVRESINAYIMDNFTVEREQRALHQMASASQSVLAIDPSNEQSAINTNSKITKAISCLYTVFPSDSVDQHPSRLSSIIEEKTFNTWARRSAYKTFNSTMSGKTWNLTLSDNCQYEG